MSERQQPDRRGIDLNRRMNTESPFGGGGTRSGGDPLQSQATLRSSQTSQNATFNQPVLYLGRVNDAVPYGHLYKVAVEGGPGTLLCTDCSHGSISAYGARVLTTLAIGTPVVVMHHPQLPYGLIMSSVPEWSFDPRASLAHFLVQGSRVGIASDEAYRVPYAAEGGAPDFNASRARDSLSGQAGYITETGIAMLIDSAMFQLCVDEETGVFGFYADQRLRIAGRNLQIRSGTYSREDLDDQTELSSEEGYSAFFHESLGGLSRETTSYTNLTAQQYQLETPEYGPLEPLEDDQMAIHRVRNWQGYLGQGGTRSVCVPVNVGDAGVLRLSDETEMVGLFQESIALDGFYSMRSARGIFILKTPIITLPKRIRRAESATGDNETNYASEGFFGTTDDTSSELDLPPHVVGETIDPNTTEHATLSGMASLLDQIAYAFNWQAVHPFFYHQKDWYLPNEEDTVAWETVENAVPQFSALRTEQLLPAAEAFQQYIDERYELVSYYANTAGLYITPSGGLMLFDGYDFELRTGAGSAVINTPGDFMLTSGRRTQVWAGSDFLVKSHRDSEISSASGDVRIKANVSLFAMAGNDVCGGIWLESRSPGIHYARDEAAVADTVTGITLKAPLSSVGVIAHEILLATTSLDGGVGSVFGSGGSGTMGEGSGSATPDLTKINGNIVIDAADGAVITRSAQLRRHLTDGAIDIFGSGSTRTINEYREDQTRFGSGVVARGDSYLWGCVTVNGGLTASGAGAFSGTGTVSSAQLGAISVTNSLIQNRETVLSDFLDFAEEESTWLIDNTDIEEVEFRFPDSAFYAPEGWIIYEPLWHQRARLADQVGDLSVWVEPKVIDSTGAESMPFPGLDIWTQTDILRQQDLTLFDADFNCAKARGMPAGTGLDACPYEDPELAEVVMTSLEGNWLVISPPE